MNSQLKQILTPFLKAGLKVLNELTSIAFSKKQVYTHQGNLSIGNVKIEIGVIGDIETRVIFDMSRDLAFQIAKMMMGDLNEAEIDHALLQDAILELGNMIAGNAMGFLEEFMLDCDIVPPKAYVGKDTDLFTAQTKLGVIEFNSPSGDFNIYVVMEESPSDMAGVLTFNIPEIINNHIIDMFIPKGINVYTTKTREETIRVLESQQDVILLFLNQMYTANTDFSDFVQVILAKRPNCHIIFYSVQSEWEPRLIERFPNSVLGFIPRAFDTAKIFQTLVMILNKLGVKYHHKRNYIRIKVTPKDNIPALLYKNLREETENIVNVSVEDLSVGGALLVLPFTSKDDFKPRQILPRAQIKLKGYVVRFKAEIMQKVENKIAVRFLDITNDDIKKLSHFIHDKLRDTVLKEILTK